MRRLFKFLLAANSIMIMAVIHLIKESIWICNYKGVSIGLYITIPVVLAGCCLLLSNGLSTDSADGGFSNVELANDNYMPSYLGYFFVALSIGDMRVLLVVFCILLVFLLCSQNLYYNPLFLLYGYKFYYVTSKSGMRMFIISKREIKEAEGLKFSNLRRINNFTFIDKERN